MMVAMALLHVLAACEPAGEPRIVTERAVTTKREVAEERRIANRSKAVVELETVGLRGIDLNAPGAMERLSVSHREHYLKILEILEGLDEHVQHEVSDWIRTYFGATDVSYSSFLLVSHPPQVALSFTLDGIRYHATVTLDLPSARIYPAKR